MRKCGPASSGSARSTALNGCLTAISKPPERIPLEEEAPQGIPFRIKGPLAATVDFPRCCGAWDMLNLFMSPIQQKDGEKKPLWRIAFGGETSSSSALRCELHWAHKAGGFQLQSSHQSCAVFGERHAVRRNCGFLGPCLRSLTDLETSKSECEGVVTSRTIGKLIVDYDRRVCSKQPKGNTACHRA